jgi:hypothetical protein
MQGLGNMVNQMLVPVWVRMGKYRSHAMTQTHGHEGNNREAHQKHLRYTA